MTETTCPTRGPSLLSPWRRRCQWLTTLLLLLIPWIVIDGKSLLRVDIPELTLHFFGALLRIEELYLVLIFSLVLTLFFLLVTMLLGRVWCGWFCPQTTLTDVAEWVKARLGIKEKSNGTFKRVLLQGVYLGLALLVSANLLWYFIEPRTFFLKLATGELHYAAWILFAITAITVYLDLAFVRRLMCSDFCPYGRFQTALADQATLALTLPSEELERCIQCNSCVRVCPMAIDIREGYQVECINCGRCLDACRQVMAKRDQPGLISYRFGTEGKGVKALFNPRALLLSLATLLLCIVLVVAVGQRPSASLKISVSHQVASRVLADGQQATFFNAWVNNRTDQQQTYHMTARRAGDMSALIIKGPVGQIQLAPGENRRIDFVLVTPVPGDRFEVEFILMNMTGEELAVTGAQIR